jgi:hypothetical protein
VAKTSLSSIAIAIGLGISVAFSSVLATLVFGEVNG